jgi:hypothetical protein
VCSPRSSGCGARAVLVPLSKARALHQVDIIRTFASNCNNSKEVAMHTSLANKNVYRINLEPPNQVATLCEPEDSGSRKTITEIFVSSTWNQSFVC